jgi:hypothetical protein
MNIFRRLVAALGVMLAASAQAHLGDTLAAATQCYGPATERCAKLPATLARGFAVGELTIEADFIHDTVHRVTYRRARAFTDEEIQKLLADNAGAYSWMAQSNRLNPLRDAIGQRVWLRSDRGSASLTRQTDDKIVSETLVLTDAVWLMANLKLRLADKPATTSAAIAPATVTPTPAVSAATAPSTVAPTPAASPAHALTWTGYDGVGDPAAAHLVLDGQDLGGGAEGLAALKCHLAGLPAKAQVKIIPYYGDPGSGTPRHPPLNLAELRTFCDAHDLSLLIPQSQ